MKVSGHTLLRGGGSAVQGGGLKSALPAGANLVAGFTSRSRSRLISYAPSGLRGE